MMLRYRRLPSERVNLRNREGLLWSEWLASATISKKVQDISPVTIHEMRKEWSKGVDPTEWAHALSTGKKG